MLGIAWADVLPDAAASAVYRVDLAVSQTPMHHDLGIKGDYQARMEYGVQWFGRAGTYDRFVLGLDTPSTPGLVLYFRLDDPWVVTFFGLESWPDGDTGRGPTIVETFADPVAFDLSGGYSNQVSTMGCPSSGKRISAKPLSVMLIRR